MPRLQKPLFCLFFLIAFAASIHPAEISTHGPADWILEKAEEGANLEGVSPVRINPLQLTKTVQATVPLQALPPRNPREVDKAEVFRRPIPPAVYTPQHIFQQEHIVAPGVSLLAPARLKSFRGLSQSRFFPADPTVAVGPSHVLVAVNSAVGIFTKGGKKLADVGFAQWFQSVTEVRGAAMFDPKVLYDQFSQHFILLVDALRDDDKGAWYLLSISKTSDPTGEWFSYALDMKKNGNKQSNNWADFPGLGIDETAIYMTGNMFSFASDNFVYAKLRIVKKSEAYSFGRVHFFDRWAMKDATGQRAATIQPAHSIGTARVEFLASLDDIRGQVLTLWSVPNPGAARPSLKKKAVTVSTYLVPPDASQKGLAALINTGDAAVRNVVAANGSIYTSHTISQNWGSGEVCALRLYQISTAGDLQQEITFGADKLFYYYPAIAADSRGNIVVVFNRSGSSEFVGVHFTGRKISQPAGQLQPSKALKISASSYFSQDNISRNRWGDYNGIAIDADNSLWIYSEFATGMANWSTQVGRVKYR
jgi:hypothetical protein